jgi:cell division protein FtsQ
VNRVTIIGSLKYSRGYSQDLLAILFMCLLAAGGAIWVAMGMVTAEQWPVRWLEVDGAFERVSAEQIRASLIPATSGSYFTVNLGKIRQAAYRQPWVETATVQKSWPDTVHVEIKEFTPVAHWIGDYLISSNGTSFEVAGAAGIQGLPRLNGPPEQLDLVFANWHKFNDELLRAGLEVGLIRLEPRGSWFLQLSNGTEVQIGREDPYKRLQRLVGSWAGLMHGKDMAPMAVDLRYTNGFAVRWPKPPDRFAGTYGKEN